jgi:hypothetical protein
MELRLYFGLEREAETDTLCAYARDGDTRRWYWRGLVELERRDEVVMAAMLLVPLKGFRDRVRGYQGMSWEVE